MEEPNFESLLSELDLRDMAGFTRNFVEDLRNALNTELDWKKKLTGVACYAWEWAVREQADCS